MTLNEIRKKYLDFFKKRGHAVVPSASLVPENDPTTLFVSSGMQPLLQYFLGERHAQGNRIANSQKCFRAEDIDEIGDNRHTTYFEMLGNWSLGDYFKKEQIGWFFEFLTNEVGLDPEKLYVTVFSGDERNNVPRDSESVEIWKNLFKEKGMEAKDVELLTEEKGGELGMQEGRIFYYDAKKNWWSRSGVPANMPEGEPGGADTEVFYDFGETLHDKKFGEHCHPNCDCGRFMEIGNSVFMEYVKKRDGSFGQLPSKNVDFGGGLERIVAASIGDNDVFNIDTLASVIKKIEEVSGKAYGDYQKEFRVITDHIRASIFMIADGVIPSNTEQGYVLRRLIRRAVRFANRLEITGRLSEISDIVIMQYKSVYPKLKEHENLIKDQINSEEEKFRRTLEKGLKEFRKLGTQGSISGKGAFILFTTHGFPIEMTIELAQERGLVVDMEAFKNEMKQHQELSREGAGQKFKGGLADTGEMSTKYHTATHLLLRALKDVLEGDIRQKGSNITSERMRFDFSYGEKMTDEQKQRVEEIVNEKIKEGLNVTNEELPIEEAHKQGIVGEFGDKYGEIVTVYRVGDYSVELCGGPHVTNTSELGVFKIKKEESVSAGVRRIKAVLE